MEIKERLHKKLTESYKTKDNMTQSIEEIEEMLEITSYDKMHSHDYSEILENKFKKSIHTFSIFAQSLQILKSKNAISF